MEVLTSARLIFTPISAADRPFLESCWDDDQMRRYLGGAMPEEKRDRVFAALRASDACWILRLGDGTPVGTGVIGDTDGDQEIGIELIADATGLGLGREACQTMLDWLAGQGVATAIAIVHEGNRASRKLMTSLGGAEERRYEKWSRPQIQYRIPLRPPPAQSSSFSES